MPKKLLASVNEDELLISICKSSFWNFAQEFWSTIIPQAPVYNWHMRYICSTMQKAAERVFLGLPKLYDIILNISPGTTKSTLISVLFPAWVWTRMPTARFICGSHTHDLVLDLSRKCRDVVNSDKYKKLFPYIVLREDQDTKGYWVNTSGGDRFSCTVGGKSPTGMHGHFLLVDDPIDPQKAVSDLELKTANGWMNNTLSSRKVEKSVSLTVLVMQRVHQNDPTGNWLDRVKKEKLTDSVFHICLPAEVTEDIRPSYLRNYYTDNLMDPIRLGESVLKNERARGQYFYAGQYLQNPIPLGGGMFKTLRIKFSPTHVQVPDKFRNIIRYWDKAGSAGGGANSVGTKMAKDDEGRFWILDVQIGQWDSAEREQIIQATAIRDGRRVIVGIEQEPGSGGKESAENTVKRLAGFRCWVFRPTGGEGNKVMRADPFSVQVNAGNVYMVEAGWNERYLDEMKHFPHSKYKDQIDSSSGGFSYLSKNKLIAGAL